MSARTEPGTPEYDERIRRIRQRLTDGPSLRSRILILIAIAVLFVAPASWLIFSTFRTDHPCISDCGTADHVFSLAIAAALLLLPARVVFLIVRRRLQTGVWTLRPTQAERATLRAKWTNPSSRSLTLLKGMGKLGVAIDVVIVFASITNLWRLLKPNHEPWGVFSVVLIAFWAFMLFQNGGNLYRWTKKKAAPAT